MLLFAGDALSYLTHGLVPALMHRVVPRPPATPSSNAPRVSAPFFLRGKRGAVLSPLPPLPPLSVAVLEHNAGNLRSAWPWKRDGPLKDYYQGVTWHEETGADGFEPSSVHRARASGLALR